MTRLRASSEELNLGRSFDFVNIRFLPVSWQNADERASYGLVKGTYTGDLPLISTNTVLIGKGFADQQAVLTKLVDTLVERKQIVANPIAERIFPHIDDIHSVADMAAASGYSPRQLQRVLKRTTGFAPHDFLKVIRLQSP